MIADPLTFAIVLPTLLVAHTVGDHVIQTDWQAANKHRSWRAMADHVVSYQGAQLLGLVVVGTAVGLHFHPWWSLAGALFSAGTHAFLDRRWPVRWVLTATGSPNFAASNIVRVRLDVDGYGRAHTNGVPTSVEAKGVLPLHGPYLADQALHWGCLFVSALLMSVGATA